MFALLALFWGTSFVAIEVGLAYFPPVLFAGVRYALAGALVLGYAAATADRWVPRGRDEWAGVGIVGALVIAAFHALLYLGQGRVGGPVAAVVVSLSPVLTAAFAGVVPGGRRLRAADAVGFLLGLAGVVVVANPDPTNVASANLAGIGLLLLGTASFALGGVLTRPLDVDLPASALQSWAMLVGAGLLGVGGLARGETLAAVEWTLPAVASLAYLTLISGVVAFLLYFELLDRIGPAELNLVGYLEPVVATTLSWLLLGHLVGTTTLVGFAGIFLGFAVVKRRTLARFTATAAAAARKC